MTIRLFIKTGVVTFFLLALMFPVGSNACQPPTSTEITYKGPGPRPEAESELDVWGIGSGKKDDSRISNAILDARKAACSWQLFDPSNGLLTRPETRNEFNTKLASSFWCEDTISQFIVSVSDILEMKEIRGNKKKRKVHVNVVVNFARIQTWLEDHGMKIGERSPAFIMVLPWVPRSGNPLQKLEENPNLRSAATTIQKHFPSNRYNIKNPSAELTIQEVVKATDLIEDNPDDYAYRIALTTGADIYVTYEIKLDTSIKLGQQVRQAVIRMEAHETATAKSLSAETGYSEKREMGTAEQALIEEAFALASNALKNDIQKYWEECLISGAPYRVVVTITEDADEDEVIDIQDCYADGVDEISISSNQSIFTASKMDFVIWADLEKYPKARKLEQALRKWIKANCDDWKLRRKNMTGKLLQANIVVNN